MSHVSPKKQGCIRCEFAMLGDCKAIDDYCPDGIKDPDSCDTFHKKMVVEGEETQEEYEAWKASFGVK